MEEVAVFPSHSVPVLQHVTKNCKSTRVVVVKCNFSSVYRAKMLHFEQTTLELSSQLHNEERIKTHKHDKIKVDATAQIFMPHRIARPSRQKHQSTLH